MTNYTAPILILLLAASLRAADPSTKPTPGSTTAPTFINVDAEEFQKLLTKKDIVLLDVRTPTEYTQGHLDGALNLNLHGRDFTDQIGQLDKEKTYLVYCAVGGRSAQACEKMSKLNFLKLYNLKGGIDAWIRVGKPVVQTPAQQ